MNTMPSSPIQGFSLANSSARNSLECTTNLSEQYNESDSKVKHLDTFRFNQGNAFIRKQVQRSSISQAQKSFNRRRFTFSGEQKMIYKKRRRFTSVALPTKFLLGGNITDPLNLGSLEDEKINQQLNAFSPAASPMPIQRSQVQVLIPPNIHDPLNLNSGGDIFSSKPRKRRRHRKGRRDEIPPSDSHKPQPDSVNETPKISTSSQECPKKLESTSKVAAKRRKAKQDTFRANAEKFCYGNHLTSRSNWNSDEASNEDHRLSLLHERFFCAKDVLDIGCNTGEMSLHIASCYHPKKVVGIDIDKKLVHKAHRTICLHLSRVIGGSLDFPSSMATLYGPLSKLARTDNSTHFPNNITFLEANYVPASEDFLETQKPEYDTILCLRVTKWIHLNFGDNGLKMAFKRMFAQLRYGGILILEPQPWFTYSTSKKITPSIYKTYQSLHMRPEMFCNYLLSSEVGFSSCQLLGKTTNYRKGYEQDIYILKKEDPNTQDPHTLLSTHLSPIPLQYNVWDCDQSGDFHSFSEFEGLNSEMYDHCNGNVEESHSPMHTTIDRHKEEDFSNYEGNANEEFLNLEHSNECFSDCEEHSNEVFSIVES